jgi:hypothetical protein
MGKDKISLFEIDPLALQELHINKFKLDEECEKNGNLYHFYSDQLVDAEYERDLLKAKIKEVEGEIELKIRAEKASSEEVEESIIPREYQKVKLTEAVVTALVNNNMDVRGVRQQLILAERKVGKLGAVVKAFTQRKSMIEGGISLWLGNYYSKPGTQKQSAGDVSSKDYNKRLNERSEM